MSNNTLEIVKSELVIARAKRNVHPEGSDEWKRRNPYVQSLKALEQSLEHSSDMTPKVVKDQEKNVRAERGRHQPNSDRYGQVNALVQALKSMNMNGKPKKDVKPASVLAAQPQDDGKKKVVAVLPPFPNVASAVAFVAQQLVLGAEVHAEPVFCHTNSPTGTQIAFWKGQCSPGQKPIVLTAQQPIEKVSSSLPGAEALNRLIDLANKAEGLASESWRSRHHIPRIMTDVYFLEGADETKIFHRLVDVVSAFLRPQNGRDWKTLTQKKYAKDLIPLWEGFNVKDQEAGTFSIPQYFRHLFCSGEDRKVIQEKIGWWIARAKACDDAFRKVAGKRFEVKPFTIWGRAAGFVTVANYWEARSFQYNWVGSGVLRVAMLRNAKGHVLIMSSPYFPPTFNSLLKRLEADEEGRWFLYTDSTGRQTLMNGGFRYDGVKPTRKGSDELTRLLVKYAKFPKPPKRK